MAYHDAILTYFQVVNESITDGKDVFDGRSFVGRFTNRTFPGIRGNFTLDGQNNLLGYFELWNFHDAVGEFVVNMRGCCSFVLQNWVLWIRT